MKTITRFNVALLSFILLLAGPTIQNATALDQSVVARLKSFGFTVFSEPGPLPPFTLPVPQGLPGTPLDSTKLAGSVTLVNFWATWCPPCKSEMPTMQRLQEAMAGYQFKIVAISLDEDDKTVTDFIKREKYSFSVFIDKTGSVGQLFVGQGIPTTYLVGKDGNAIGGVVGSRQYDSSSFIALMKELAGK
jgi:thiol-disulfide isomerase/thioredoxin